MTDTVRALLDQVISWLGKDATDNLRTALNKFLREEIPGWIKLTYDAVKNGVSWGLERLKDFKDVILQKCREHDPATRHILVEFGAKSLGRLAVSKATAEVGKTAAKGIAKRGSKVIAKKGSVAIFSKTVFKGITATAAKTSLKTVLKSAATPVGVVADIGQAGLEAAGYKRVGKAVGQSGNVASGAMLGFALGGPVGAGVGAAGGYALWLAGEVAGEYFEKMIS